MDDWIKKDENKRWLNGYTPAKKRQKIKETSTEDHSEEAVTYRPIKCPKCGSKKNNCYKTDLPVRYHKCLNCGWRFKSIEKDE